jgi:hypothetical protein
MSTTFARRMILGAAAAALVAALASGCGSAPKDQGPGGSQPSGGQSGHTKAPSGGGAAF